MRVALFVGTRADLGPLSPVIDALERRQGIELHLLCGVAFGKETLIELVRALDIAVEPERVHELAEPLPSSDRASILSHGVRLSEGARRLFASAGFECLVVLGDRWELLFVVPMAYLGGIPIVHIHGGEVTEGALDERVRHAVTKLADVHCVASPDAARRVSQLGEPTERIRVTGAPGLDRLRTAPQLGLDELSATVNTVLTRPIALFTYHPPTAVPEAPLYSWAADALSATLSVCPSVIVTRPGLDEGSEQVNQALDDIAARDSRAVVVDALGATYPSVLSSVDVVVGNSSSGVIEAATVGQPVVNVGTRQSGRLRGSNVIDALDSSESVSAAIRTALSPEFRASARAATNPYGDGHAAERIVAAIIASGGMPRPKAFVDSREPL